MHVVIVHVVYSCCFQKAIDWPSRPFATYGSNMSYGSEDSDDLNKPQAYSSTLSYGSEDNEDLGKPQLDFLSTDDVARSDDDLDLFWSELEQHQASVEEQSLQELMNVNRECESSIK